MIVTSQDIRPAFWKCWYTHYHILHSPHPPEQGRQLPHLMVWKEASKSSASTSKLSPQLLGISPQSLWLAMCWDVKAASLKDTVCILEELLRAWGVTTYSRTKHTSAEPHPQINLLKGWTATLWLAPAYCLAPWQLCRIFFKTNKWTPVTKGWRASVPEKCREEKENEPQKKGGEQSSLGIPKPETLSSRPRTKQAEGIWVPHEEKRQKEQQWKKDLFPKQRGRKWTHSLRGLLIFIPYQYLKREAYGFVRYDLREFYANCPDTFTNRAQTRVTTHGNLYLLTAQFNAHTWRCCCVFKVNDQPCSIIKHSPTQTHIKLMITIVHFEGQKWSRNTVIKRSS